MGGPTCPPVMRCPVLTLTDAATTLIQDLLHHAKLPAGAGLRIAQRNDHPALAMTLAEQAEPRDVVVRDGATAVFLGPVAAARLTRQTLDASVNETGSAFYLRD
jgi:iron-sulfur cluster assembly protein